MTAPSERTQDVRRQLIATLRAHVHHDTEGAEVLSECASVDDLARLCREAIGVAAFLLELHSHGRVDEAIDALARDMLRAPEPPDITEEGTGS